MHWPSRGNYGKDLDSKKGTAVAMPLALIRGFRLSLLRTAESVQGRDVG